MCSAFRGRLFKRHIIPEQAPVIPEARHPEYREGSPEYREGSPEYREGSPEYREGSPEYREGSPGGRAHCRLKEIPRGTRDDVPVRNDAPLLDDEIHAEFKKSQFSRPF
jgi:hypothetical protein